eukprot:7390105-Prymnesium_polylepis.1
MNSRFACAASRNTHTLALLIVVVCHNRRSAAGQDAEALPASSAFERTTGGGHAARPGALSVGPESGG